MNIETFDFASLSLERLRDRRSAKWSCYPPDVLPAWVAEMDFPLAPAVKQALSAAIERDDCGYAWPAGVAAAFVRFAIHRFDWIVDADRVRLVADVMTGVAEVLRVLTSLGDGVVINPPIYPPFYAVLQDTGRPAVEVPLLPTSVGWRLDFDALQAAFAAGARAYLLCNPHNPTGLVLAEADLRRIAELANRYDVAVVADEIHAPLVLAGARHTPYAGLGEEAAARGVTLTSASKGWNIAGLKCALIVAGSAVMQERLAAIPPGVGFHVGHLGGIASVAAFEHGVSWLDAVVGQLDRNRVMLAELLRAQLPAVGYQPPQAGYLAWLDCRALGLGDDPAEVFLEGGRVALSPGPRFGSPGLGWARLNFGTSPNLLAEAVRRMAGAVGQTS